jgi:cytochrome P450
MTSSHTVPITNIDLMSPELAADPWPALQALREQGPVIWHETHKRWLLTGDRVIRKVVLDFDRFTVEGTVVEDLFGADAFISMDDRHRHNQLREVWADAFRPAALKAFRATVAKIVDDLLDPVAEKLNDGEAVDLTDGVCRSLPTLVIALMMGVPQEMLADVVRWSDAMAGGGANYLSDAARNAAIRAREEAKTGLADYLCQLIHLRRKNPRDDLISIMVKSDAAKTLADAQLVQNLRQLLFAGNETSGRWLGHLFLTYAQNADVQRELAKDRKLIVAANEEVMRWQGVIGTLPRRLRGGPIDIGGIQLADGDHVTCLIGTANRDPASFENPDAFDIHRKPQPNLGFGVGLHNCLGAVLARMEAELAVSALLDRVPGFVVTAPHRYTSLPVRGPLPVTIALAKT